MKILKEIGHNEEGSALSSVLIIAVIILTFIGAIFSGVILQARFIQRDINQTQSLYLAEQQLFEFLSDTSIVLPNISSEFRNGYLHIKSEVSIGSSNSVIEALVGGVQYPGFERSVIVLDSTSALSLAGTTKLQGEFEVPFNAVQTNSFRGIPFRGVIDAEPTEEKTLVRFDSTHYVGQLNHYQSIFDDPEPFRRFTVDNDRLNESIIANLDTLYFEESIELDLDNHQFSTSKTFIVQGSLSLTGNEKLPDFTTIIVRDSLTLSGSLTGNFIQLYAGDYVEINKESNFSAQILTNGTIAVNDQTYLKYPSVLFSFKENYSGGSNSVISINDESIVDGTLLYPVNPNLVNQEQLKVSIDTTALVRGAIYTKGLTELFGTVFGTVITDQFYFYESPTSYFNWIKDATIDLSQRPNDFVSPIGFSESPRFKILNWRITE